MNSDIETLAAIAAGFKRGRLRLEEQRIKDIRQSDAPRAIQSFDLAFKSAMQHSFKRKTIGLSKLQRVLFGVER